MMIWTTMPFSVATTAMMLMVLGDIPVNRSKTKANGAGERASSARSTLVSEIHATSM